VAQERIVWARHPLSEDWHAIKALHSNGSTETYCHGRWESGETCALDIEPDHGDRCRACDNLVYIEQIVVDG